jgi:hypothetical protein
MLFSEGQNGSHATHDFRRGKEFEMNHKELYVKETGNQAIIDDDYFDWLEQKTAELSIAKDTMQSQIQEIEQLERSLNDARRAKKEINPDKSKETAIGDYWKSGSCREIKT